MRCALHALLVFLSFGAKAQPGPIDAPLHVVVVLDHALYRDGAAQYMVISSGADTLKAESLRPAHGDSVLSFMIHRSQANAAWSVKYLPGGAMMDLLLNYEPSPLGLTLRIPFDQGAFELDSRRLMKCVADQAEDLRPRDARRPGRNLEHPFGTVDTLACHGGQILYSRGGGSYAEIAIQDLTPFVHRHPRTPPTSEREASYPGGAPNFERFITTHFSKPLIERIGARVNLSALVTIETDGSIHQVHLNGSAYPELDREFKRVLQLSSWWEPASQVNAQINNDAPAFWFTEQSKVIEYTVDPDSIWSEIPEEWLTLEPASPSSSDSMEIHLHWSGASCGRYAAKTEVLPPQPGQDFRDVILRFGAEVQPMCCDIAYQYFTHKMAPLEPGRYRLRRLPHGELPDGASWASDPYFVRYFEVKP